MRTTTAKLVPVVVLMLALLSSASAQDLPILIRAHDEMLAARQWNGHAMNVQQLKADFNTHKWIEHPFVDPATGRRVLLDFQKNRDASNRALDASVEACLQRAEHHKQRSMQLLAAQGVRPEELDKALADKWAETGPPEWRALWEAASIQLVKCDFKESDWLDQTKAGNDLVFTLRVTNKRPDAIRAMKGQVVLLSLFDEPLLTVSVTFDEGLAPSRTVDLKREMTFNRFKDSHQEILRANPKDIQVLWVPEGIVYADGRRLQLPRGTTTVIAPWRDQLVEVSLE